MILAPPALAQNNGGVFGPVVNEEDKTAEVRISFDPDRDSYASRIHYQQAFSDSLRGRVVVQGSDGPGRDFDVNFVQTELLWQLTPDGQSYQTALRFDGNIPTDGGPGAVNISWTNQFNMDENWQSRGLILLQKQVGSGSREGLFVQTRGNVSRKAGAKGRLGVEFYNFWGTTDNFRDLNLQTHQAGPYGTVKLGDGWSMLGSALFGLTDASPDAQLRFWVSKTF